MGGRHSRLPTSEGEHDDVVQGPFLVEWCAAVVVPESLDGAVDVKLPGGEQVVELGQVHERSLGKESQALLGRSVAETSRFVEVGSTTRDFMPVGPVMGAQRQRSEEPGGRTWVPSCEFCGLPAGVPYRWCRFCRRSPVWHHGRCCWQNPGRPNPDRPPRYELVDDLDNPEVIDMVCQEVEVIDVEPAVLSEICEKTAAG